MARTTYTTTRSVGTPSASSRRITVVFVVVLIVLAAVIARIVFLQVLSHERYRDLAARQDTMEKVLAAHRGEIFLKNSIT